MTKLAEQVRVARSGVHGRGLFARKRLRAGAYIGTFEGTPTTQNGTHVLWALDEDGIERGIIGRNVLRFLNHDARPNAEFVGVELYATRNIQPDAEIFIDYGWGD